MNTRRVNPGGRGSKGACGDTRRFDGSGNGVGNINKKKKKK